MGDMSTLLASYNIAICASVVFVRHYIHKKNQTLLSLGDLGVLSHENFSIKIAQID